MRMANRLMVAAAAAALLAAAPSLAQSSGATAEAPAPDGAIVTNGHDANGDRVIILNERHAGPDGAAGGEHRKMRVFALNGPNGADCADHPLVDESNADGRQRTKIILCTRGEELSAADRSAHLEHVLERIQHMDGLSDATKERVTAALRGAIDELHNSH